MKMIIFPLVFILGGFLMLGTLAALIVGGTEIWMKMAGLDRPMAILCTGATIMVLFLGSVGIMAAREYRP